MKAWSAIRRVLDVALFLAVVIGLWAAIVEITGIHSLLLPGPQDVGRVLVDSTPALIRSMMQTMETVAWGFFLGGGGGFLLGVLIRYFAVVRRALYPLTVVMYVVPKAVFVPLFVVWWGVGPTYKWLVTALLVFFPVMENTIAGLHSATTDMVDLSRSLKGNRWLTFRKIELPCSLPYVLAGLRIGLTEAFIGAVLVELIVPHSGIGSLIVQASIQSNTQFIIAGIIVIASFGIISYLLLERIERRLTSWY